MSSEKKEGKRRFLSKCLEHKDIYANFILHDDHLFKWLLVLVTRLCHTCGNHLVFCSHRLHGEVAYSSDAAYLADTPAMIGFLVQPLSALSATAIIRIKVENTVSY
jgi:hypothetical protein